MFGSEKLNELPARVLLGRDSIADVGPVETAAEDLRILQSEALDDLVPGPLVGSSGQADSRNAGKTFVQHGKLPIIRPEVVAPLGHAVRFVYREKADLGTPDKRLHALGQKAFGRDVEEVQLAVQKTLLDLALNLIGQGGIQKGSSNAQLKQGFDLILHQGDQGRNDDARAGTDQGRNLIAERLAAAGGHQYQRIAPRRQVIDDGALLAAKSFVAEDAPQDLKRVFRHDPLTCRRRRLFG